MRCVGWGGMSAKWMLLSVAPPSLGSLMRAIDGKKRFVLDQVLVKNPGLVAGKCEPYGDASLLLIAAGHRHGLWVLRSFAGHPGADINAISTEPGLLLAARSPSIFQDVKEFVPGFADKGFARPDGAALRTGDEHGWTPLLIAVLLGSLDTIRFLLATADLQTCTQPSHLSIMDLAAARGNASVRALVEKYVKATYLPSGSLVLKLQNALIDEAKVKSMQRIVVAARLPLTVQYQLLGVCVKQLASMQESAMDGLCAARGVLPGHLARLKRELAAVRSTGVAEV